MDGDHPRRAVRGGDQLSRSRGGPPRGRPFTRRARRRVPHRRRIGAGVSSTVSSRRDVATTDSACSRWTGETLAFASNRSPGVMRLDPGVYGLSNHLLDTSWPKVTEGKTELERLLAEPRRARRGAARTPRGTGPRGRRRALRRHRKRPRAQAVALVTVHSWAATTERGRPPSSCSKRAPPGVFVERSFDSNGTAIGDAVFELGAGGVSREIGLGSRLAGVPGRWPAATGFERKEARDETVIRIASSARSSRARCLRSSCSKTMRPSRSWTSIRRTRVTRWSFPRNMRPTCTRCPTPCSRAAAATAKKVAGALARDSWLPMASISLQCNGPAAAQSVMHFHVHVLPRVKDDRLAMNWGLKLGDIEAIGRLAERIREQM